MDPTLKYGLIGAGVGAGLGSAANLLVGDKKKDKVKQALKGAMVGGALGGAAGAGLGYFRDSLGLEFLKDKNEESKAPASVSEKLKGSGDYTKFERKPRFLKIIEDKKSTIKDNLTKQHEILAAKIANDPDFVNQIEKYGWGKKNLEDLEYDQDKQLFDILESNEEKALRSEAGIAYLNWRRAAKSHEDSIRADQFLKGIYQ